MAAPTIRVRMYRTGFGDCFLVRFGGGKSPRHVLIDFGAHMHGEIGTMDAVMEDIEKETQKKLAVVVATHAHRDHISGFGKFAARFADFAIGEVWLPWTDDPKDADAAKFTAKHLALYDALQRHLKSRAATGDARTNALALDALNNLTGNAKATSELARGFGTGAAVRYLAAGASIPKAAKVSGLSAQVLAPPRDPSFFSRMDPPDDQTYLRAAAGGRGGAGLRPFPRLELAENPRGGFPDGQPRLADATLALLRSMAELPAGRLALALDSVRNNTSLVLLLRYRGRSLLFPGDAQWGNWQSWIGTDAARTLLADLDFFKVAHHGSENATPKDVVHGLTKAGGVASMVSTQVKPFPTIPRTPLLTDLEKHSRSDVVVRSDWIPVAGAPAGPAAPAKLKNVTPGLVWIDYSL